jgi:tetratricopeptide (TPR) repeat protein
MATQLPPSWTKHIRPAPAAAQPMKQVENPMLSLQAGVALQRQGKFLDAERIYQHVLQREPENAEALHLMGTLALEAEEKDLAIEYFEKAVRRKPRDAHFNTNLGNTYLDVGAFEEALKYLRKANDLKPNLVEALCGIARTYVKLNRAEMAIPFYEKALKFNRSHPQVCLGMANTFINLGRMDEGVALLNETIARNVNVSSAYGALASSRKFSGVVPELDRILQLLADPLVRPGDASHLHHAAGKILNDLKRYDEAMNHYEQAKLIAGRRFKISEYRKFVDEMIAVFTPMLMLSKQGMGDPSHVPVFIVGMPRSGTTLTEQIASSHPQVYGAGELYKLRNVAMKAHFNRRNAKLFGDALKAMTAAGAQEFAADYLNHLKTHSREALRIVDKMPHNFELIGLIALIFPNAKIIHCKRDPIDNCVSCFMNEFSEAHGYNADQKNLGLYYREYDRLMAHWKRLLPGRIYENTYENMIADQEGETRSLIEFLDVPWDDACLRYEENDRTVNTISRWQVRQPIYKTSVKRWKNYESKLQPLIQALGDLASP